jgi:hypothetical protein
MLQMHKKEQLRQRIGRTGGGWKWKSDVGKGGSGGHPINQLRFKELADKIGANEQWQQTPFWFNHGGQRA